MHIRGFFFQDSASTSDIRVFRYATAWMLDIYAEKQLSALPKTPSYRDVYLSGEPSGRGLGLVRLISPQVEPASSEKD